jgi:hypothetical protein
MYVHVNQCLRGTSDKWCCITQFIEQNNYDNINQGKYKMIVRFDTINCPLRLLSFLTSSLQWRVAFETNLKTGQVARLRF